jgi:hypothetical protein
MAVINIIRHTMEDETTTHNGWTFRMVSSLTIPLTSTTTNRFLRGVSSSSELSPEKLEVSFSSSLEPQDHDEPHTGFMFRSPAMIAWYCFVSAVVVPTLCCTLYCWCAKYQSQRRAQWALDQELQLESDLARLSQIQANVQVFSAGEHHRHARIIRTAVRTNTVVRFYDLCMVVVDDDFVVVEFLLLVGEFRSATLSPVERYIHNVGVF